MNALWTVNLSTAVVQPKHFSPDVISSLLLSSPPRPPFSRFSYRRQNWTRIGRTSRGCCAIWNRWRLSGSIPCWKCSPRHLRAQAVLRKRSKFPNSKCFLTKKSKNKNSSFWPVFIAYRGNDASHGTLLCLNFVWYMELWNKISSLLLLCWHFLVIH